MKYFIFAAAILCMFAVGPCQAQEDSTAAKSAEQAAAADNAVVDNRAEETDAQPIEPEEPVMPEYESFDENTGLPNVVPSDSTGELE